MKTNKQKATQRVATIGIIALAAMMVFAFIACKNDDGGNDPPPEQPKVQPDTLKTFTLGTADCAVTIISNDTFTAAEWETLCNDVVTAIIRGYNNADQWQIYDFEPAFGKDQNATIVLEKNLEYNWQVKSGENQTVHIKVASIDTIKFEDFAQYIAESYPGNG